MSSSSVTPSHSLIRSMFIGRQRTLNCSAVSSNGYVARRAQWLCIISTCWLFLGVLQCSRSPAQEYLRKFQIELCLACAAAVAGTVEPEHPVIDIKHTNKGSTHTACCKIARLYTLVWTSFLPQDFGLKLNWEAPMGSWTWCILFCSRMER
jgi:hypothetical protein